MPTWLVKSWDVARTHPQLIVACCLSGGLLLQCWSSSLSFAVHEAGSAAVATAPAAPGPMTIAAPTATVPAPLVTEPPAELKAIHHVPNLPLPDPIRPTAVQSAAFVTPVSNDRPTIDSRPAWLPGTIEAGRIEEDADGVTSELEVTIRPRSRL